MYSRPFRKSYATNLLVMSDLTLDSSFKVKLGQDSIKMPISLLLLLLGVSNVQSTFRKPYAVHLLAMSNLTLDISFKIKLGFVNIKVPISCLLLVLEGQTRVCQYKSAYISLIIGSRGLQYTGDL